MSNKPVLDAKASDGYVLHDASDPRCKGHEQAKRHKGIQARLDRKCPACVPDSAEYTAGSDVLAKPIRKRRKATRPAA